MVAKNYTPITLFDFELVSVDPEKPITKQQVIDDLLSMIKWMKDNQEVYYSTYFDTLDKFIENEIEVKGISPHSTGRKLEIEAPKPEHRLSYNMSEMFRANVVTKLMLGLQNLGLETIIASIENEDDLTASNVLKVFKAEYPFLKKPTHQFTANTIERIKKYGTTQGAPSPDGMLPTWATDGHTVKVKRNKREVFLTMSLPTCSKATLLFMLPKKDRFAEGDITRPNIYINKKGKLAFSFTLKKEAPELIAPTGNALGVDLGLRETMAATLVLKDGYSSPYYDNRRVRAINRKIKRLNVHSASLWHKEQKCRLNDHEHKADILETERKRIAEKRSNLKRDRAYAQASRIIEIADSYGATIVLERLEWSPSGKSWDRAQQQQAIVERAAKKGLPAKKVSAKNTSQACFKCSKKVKKISDRNVYCGMCRRKTNRDVNSSRNIAKRAIPRYSFREVQQVSAPARVSRPASPVVNLNKLETTYPT